MNYYGSGESLPLLKDLRNERVDGLPMSISETSSIINATVYNEICTLY